MGTGTYMMHLCAGRFGGTGSFVSGVAVRMSIKSRSDQIWMYASDSIRDD